jgi:hypothetical protein
LGIVLVIRIVKGFQMLRVIRPEAGEELISVLRLTTISPIPKQEKKSKDGSTAFLLIRVLIKPL